MEGFHDIRFPLHLAFGASGGPVRTTEISQLVGGIEVRNARGKHSKRRYNAVAGLKSRQEAIELIQFYESRLGPLFGFRFRDPLDNASAETPSAIDQFLGVGDGVKRIFHLRKAYGEAPYIYFRPISKPVQGTVLVAVDGADVSVSVNHQAGQISFAQAPAEGAIITAGFEFDVPVRFAAEALDIVLDDFGAAQIQDIPLVEILPSMETVDG